MYFALCRWFCQVLFLLLQMIYGFVEFTSSEIISVKEDTPVGTKVHSLETGGVNAVYSLLYVSHPGINITGSGSVIIGDKGLDYETIEKYLLVVKASSVNKPT